MHDARVHAPSTCPKEKEICDGVRWREGIKGNLVKGVESETKGVESERELAVGGKESESEGERIRFLGEGAR